MEGVLDDKQVFQQKAWANKLRDVARRINGALMKQDHTGAKAAREALFHGLEELKRQYPVDAEVAMKASRNELIRVYMVHGWYREAAEVARLAVKGLEIDRHCPNREAIVRQTLARVLIESGQIRVGQAELHRAIRANRTFLTQLRKAWRLRPDLNRASTPHHNMGKSRTGQMLPP